MTRGALEACSENWVRKRERRKRRRKETVSGREVRREREGSLCHTA